MEIKESTEALIYTQTIVIKAEISKVWDALINPEMTKQYMFGCVPITDWEIGSKLIWKGAADGVEYVIGEVLKFKPNECLSFTTYGPHSGYEDKPENYLSGEYSLRENNGETTLTMTQGDFSKVEDGQKRYEEAQGAWDMSMPILKELLEKSE